MGERIAGIDLGTTYSAAGVFKLDKAELVAFNSGDRFDASWFFYNAGDEICGSAAQDKFNTNPEFCMYDSKRMISKTYNEVKNDSKSYINVVERNGKPIYEIKDGEGKSVGTFTPEDVHEKILRHLKKDLDTFNGSKLTKVVIGVPATFDKNQREATMRAALINAQNSYSSTDVYEGVKLIKEPVAAALAYIEGDTKVYIPNGSKILIYDFGGGTFDLALLEYDNGYLNVKGTGGDPHLGGEDITNAILKEFAPKFKIDLESTDPKIVKKKGKLFKTCEKSKRLFVNENSVTIECADDDEELTYAKFCNLSDPFVDRTIKITKDFLKKHGLRTNDIFKVIATGGSSKLRNVKEKLVTEFHIDHVHISDAPFEDVARGTVIYGHKFLEQKTVAPIGIRATRDKKKTFIEIIPIGTKWGETITITGVNDNKAPDALFKFYEYDVSEENYLGRLVLPFNEKDKNKKINSILVTLKVRINYNGELIATASYEDGPEKTATIRIFKTKEDFE